ncbi:amphi-Trp domain-containing protein [Paracoccus sp. M683]|uniref:amphi-Trp domain-containing protein n=1 Tax=Paracoccus sp. M683 TaxID=2594268 RepID=UPI00117C79BA|nr:amphi-Trp domain-containing protein [Paracoccus sp. M683]TRW95631.1 amphi-Trp domain-containing protein [Paracoccus sp. M683]
MKDDRDVEKTLDLSAFIAELRRLADSLEQNGSFEIEIEGETVRIPADAIFSIEHEREDGREELEFQLAWGEYDEEDDEDKDEESSDENEA